MKNSREQDFLDRTAGYQDLVVMEARVLIFDMLRGQRSQKILKFLNTIPTPHAGFHCRVYLSASDHQLVNASAIYQQLDTCVTGDCTRYEVWVDRPQNYSGEDTFRLVDMQLQARPCKFLMGTQTFKRFDRFNGASLGAVVYELPDEHHLAWRVELPE